MISCISEVSGVINQFNSRNRKEANYSLGFSLDIFRNTINIRDKAKFWDHSLNFEESSEN